MDFPIENGDFPVCYVKLLVRWPWKKLVDPLVMTNRLLLKPIEHGHLFIVSFPMKNGDFP